MMDGKIKYEFVAKTWQHSAPNGWYFVSLPHELAIEIRQHCKWQEEGWGRLKATAKVGDTQWDTAIWFDSKHKTYLLPLKSAIRKKEKIETGKEVKAIVWI